MKKYHVRIADKKIMLVENLFEMHYNKENKEVTPNTYEYFKNSVFNTIKYLEDNPVGFWYKFKNKRKLQDMFLKYHWAEMRDKDGRN